MSDCDHSQAEHAATRRLTKATYLLVFATAALVLVTAVLTAATLKEKSVTGHELVVTREVGHTGTGE
ncbi:hypothetical protein AWB92_24785 [Mycobacterium sp. IEC1808]|uniref:hypothetical protein n=1 Tax=Mycobacterium sp. IEC1808 TaxID=1743230 RepID=UPI000A162B75|nr:hypothetical protein [Mycobacterium sp. IEC1808]ORW86905.1 hypothetical protein AWB92_24785 [Mycobacterium sp. IEC1808]